MRQLGVTFALAVFLVGTMASSAALGKGGRGGGHGRGHHASGSITTFQRSAPRAAAIVTAPVYYGAYRFPYYYRPQAYYPLGMYARAPYYGAGAYWPYYVPDPYADAPGPYPDAIPYPPPEYIERGQEEVAPDAEPAAAQPSWWFCPGANNYYPYVRTCPGGWQQVRP